MKFTSLTNGLWLCRKWMEKQLFDEIDQMKENREMAYITMAERKGLQRGREQGKIEELHEAIELVLHSKFGIVEKNILNKLAQIDSIPKLENILHNLPLMSSLEEFRKNWKCKNFLKWICLRCIP